MQKTVIEQLKIISDYIYSEPYDDLTDYLKGIRDMMNLLNGREQNYEQLCDDIKDIFENDYNYDEKIPFIELTVG